MKTLQENYRIFVLLGICPSEKPISRCMKIFDASVSAICLIIVFIALISSFVYFLNNHSISLVSAIFAIAQIVAALIIFSTLVVAHAKRYDIKKVFNNIQIIYDANKHIDPIKYMKKANQQADQITTFFYKYIIVIVPTSVINSSAISLMYNKWKYGFINPDNLYRNYRFVLPWNQHTLQGWMAETCFTFFFVLSYCLVIPVILTLFVSICNYHRAFYEMFRLQIANIDTETGFKPFPIDRIKKQMHESISFHIAAKKLFYQTAEVFSPFVLIQLVCNMFIVAGIIFRMDWAIHNFSIEVCFMVLGTLMAASMMFLYCQNGKQTADYYAEYANCLYECNWCMMPIHLQNYFILMIAHAQKPLFYHGCGLMKVNLETFLKIFKTVVSYYMMFKTLTDAL